MRLLTQQFDRQYFSIFLSQIEALRRIIAQALFQSNQAGCAILGRKHKKKKTKKKQKNFRKMISAGDLRL